jgi:uncharacterized protein
MKSEKSIDMKSINAKSNNKTNLICRIVIYLLGIIVLALGLILNTEAGMGASAILSVPYTISQGTGLNFANLTLIFYCLLVVAEFIVKGSNRQLIDVLQIPFSIVFTRFMNLFKVLLGYESGVSFTRDLITLIIGLILTGVGVCLIVDMQLIPNPGDGIVSAIADRIHKDLGFTKNCVDFSCLCISLILGFFFGSPLLGVGLGTVLAMIGVGRVIAIFNHFAKDTLCRLAGLSAGDSH